MESLTVEQSLFLSEKATFKGEVRLNGAKIGGYFDVPAPPSRSP